MQIRYDWHVHSHHSPCGSPEAALGRLAEGIRAAGVTRWGLVDHLFTEQNVPALEAARREYDALNEKDGIVFAVEASVLRDWDIEQTRQTGNIWGYHPGGPEGELTMYLPENLIQRLGIRYVIGGAHWALGAEMTVPACVRTYHRQNMFLAEHPRVDIIAHPWWWRTKFSKPDGAVEFRWLEDFSVIPRSMHDEFAAAARQHGKRIEISGGLPFSKDYGESWRPQYLEYLAGLKAAGCTFSTGTDSHDSTYRGWPDELPEALRRLGFAETDFWPGPDA